MIPEGAILRIPRTSLLFGKTLTESNQIMASDVSSNLFRKKQMWATVTVKPFGNARLYTYPMPALPRRN